MQEEQTIQERQFNRMTEQPIKKLLISLSIPAILSMLVTNIYNIADTAFVGMLGTSESGATGIVFSFMTILQAVAFMCGQGAGSIMARKLGAKDIDGANEITSTGFFMSFGLGLTLGGASLIIMEPILKLLGSTPTILPHAKTYVLYIAIAAPFFTSSLTLNNILRYEGKAKLGTIGMMTGAVLNIGLDALLMLVFKLGMHGAGIATASSQIISFVILLLMFITGKTQTKISFKKTARSFKPVWNIFTTGFPSLLRQGLTGVSTILLNQFAGSYGDPAVAAFSCVSRISFFATAIAIGIGQGFQPISSFNYGAKKMGRVKVAFWTALVSEELVMTVLSVPIFIFAPQLVRLLRNDPEVIKIGGLALRFMSVALLFMPLTMMIEMAYQSIGSKLLATVTSSLRSGLLLIPSILILANTCKLLGLQLAQPVSIVLAFAIDIGLCAVYLIKLKRETPPPEEPKKEQDTAEEITEEAQNAKE